jgi:hypothetical protein
MAQLTADKRTDDISSSDEMFWREQTDLDRVFRYRPEQWLAIEKAIEPLRPSDEDLVDIRWRLCRAGASYLSNVRMQPEEQKRRRQMLQSWRRVETYSRRIMSELQWLHGVDDSFARAEEFYKNQPDALSNIMVTAKGRAVHLADKINDGFPKITLKQMYQSVVLGEWAALGGKLKFSRHPVKGKIKGPLAKYFSAVTEPVYGGSPESLPDIIRRHVELQSEITRWSICMSSIGFDTPAVRRALSRVSREPPEHSGIDVEPEGNGETL